jgi:hypothetical protein
MGIETLKQPAPTEFKRMCRNFGPNLTDFVSSESELVQHALIGIDQSDSMAIRPFLDHLLSSQYSNDDLKEFWWTMPVTAVFSDGSEVRKFLMRLREALSRSPYADAS